MPEQRSGLSRPLTETTEQFFQAKLSLTPERVSILEQEGTDSVVIKVEGFLSKADAGLAKSPEGSRFSASTTPGCSSSYLPC